MKSNRCLAMWMFTFLSAILFACPAACFGDHATTPIANHGKPWRIAYYEGGPYIDYEDCMHAIINGLMELGWIEKATLPRLASDTSKPYWDWLVNESKSRFLKFYAEDAYSAEWSDEQRAATKKAVIEKLQSGKIDLVIAMGTWAGLDLANNRHHVPTTVVSTSNPLQAGIVKSAEDSGLDHVTARVDPDRYLRQIRMFHRLLSFNKLGVTYEDTPDGRLYASLPELEQVASERKFELVHCRFDDTNEDRKIAGQDCLACIRRLADDADAIYLTALLSADEQIDPIVQIMKERKIPSFSMIGSKYVKKGVLMSISTDEGYHAQGMYDAEKIASILNGAKPRDLKQISADPLDIAINMETARAIGFAVPNSILRIAHEIYGNHE